MTAPLYELRGVTKDFEGRRVLDIDRLTLDPGCLTVVQGPNGAGKTTLLRLLAFLLAPDSGRLWFEGVPVERGLNHLTALRRRVSFVAQDSYLFNGTVEKNVAYGLAVRGADRRQRTAAVRRALEAVGLAGFERRKARRLSRGESQRTALARALALDPEVLLLDEPFTAVDRAHLPHLEQVIAELPAQGCGVVLVTHDQAQAQRLAQRMVNLDQGRPAADQAYGDDG